MPWRRERGRDGENLAAAALARRGYVVLERNWRIAAPVSGEIDLIAREGGEIVFVEVRSSWDNTARALESIGPQKAERLTRLAYAYLAAHGLENATFRIDVVAVCRHTGGVEIVRDAVAAAW